MQVHILHYNAFSLRRLICILAMIPIKHNITHLRNVLYVSVHSKKCSFFSLSFFFSKKCSLTILSVPVTMSLCSLESHVSYVFIYRMNISLKCKELQKSKVEPNWKENKNQVTSVTTITELYSRTCFLKEFSLILPTTLRQ